MNATPDVRVGQVWADNDRRHRGRTLRVISVSSDRAHCQILTVARNVSPSRIGGTTNIALRRFRPTSTGYRLVQDVEVTR